MDIPLRHSSRIEPPSVDASLDLEVLLERALQGEQAARLALWERLMPTVRWAVLRVFGGFREHEDIEEVVSGAFLTLLEKLEKGERPDNLRGFASGLGSNLAKQYLEKYNSHRHDPLHEEHLPSRLDWTRPSAPDPEREVMINRQLHLLLKRMSTDLKPQECQVFKLHFIDDLPAQEVATRLQITPNYVHQHVAQIRKWARSLGEDL